MAYRQEQRQEGVQQQQQQEQEFVGPTLCILRTHKNIRKERIFAVLRQLKLGWIGKIDMVPKKSVEKNPDGTENTKDYVRVYIHFTKWFTDNRQTQQFLERLDSSGFVHIVYDEPWFWKITKYVRSEPNPQPQSRHPRPRIDFGAAAATVPTTIVPTTIVPVQVLKSVSVSRGRGSDSGKQKQKYWETQAQTATAAVMAKHHSTSPTPRSHGSDSESSPSPSRLSSFKKLSVRLFD